MTTSETKSRVDFDYGQMQALVRPGGDLSRIVPGFCHRQEQEDLLVRIAEAMAGDEFLLAEAGTGVGKSLAYLIPAVFWAASGGEPVVISTRTKALQEQLVNEDLPRLQQAVPFHFSFELVKGRENYLCRNKLAGLIVRGNNLSDEQQEFLQKVVAWVVKTASGDRQELRLEGRLMSSWPLVACDRRTCLRERCSYQDSCFRQRLLKRLNQADLIVVNHSLLLADTRLEKGILPEYRHLIIDEAHNLEREAFDKFAVSFNLAEIRDSLNSLVQKKRKVQTGFLAMLRHRYAYLKAEFKQVGEAKETCLQQLEVFFKLLGNHLAPTRAEEANYSRRWPSRSRSCEAILDVFIALERDMNALVAELRGLVQELQDNPEALELEALVSYLQELAGNGGSIMHEALDDPEQVVWVDFNNGNAVAITSSPLKLGEKLDENLYQKLDSLVMVSATLSVGGGFAHFIERTGLEYYLQDKRLTTITRPSPFDYERCCRFYLVNDLPEPNHRQFQSQVTGILQDLLARIPGRTLVLFTSRRMMQDTARFLRPLLTGTDITLLVQYENGDFATLVEQMVKADRAVLMGLDTFWEGVDLRGDYLTCVVIVKMPFRSPSDPLVSAWSDYYQANGESGFFKFLLPDAVLRFKQGIGRLIRSESDWGAVVILDRRLAAPPRGKSYGQLFHRSLPGKIIEVNSLGVGDTVSRWLESFS